MKKLYILFFIFSYAAIIAQVCPSNSSTNKVLIAGDSWAQYMSDDGTHNKMFDKFGHADKDLIGPSLGANPGPGYTGTEYAISGSEAREWADRVNYPWITNVINAINANPSIETVILSIGGNDILAAKSGGGWYKDMDLDVAGSEAALFATIRANTFVIINDILAVHPNVEIVLSSYDYPNFNTGFLCFAYACPKRNDLSRNATTSLITDAELNQMMITVETERISWLSLEPRLKFANAIGLSHYYYGDGVSAAGVYALPEQMAPYSVNFYGGNKLRPAIRSNFRNTADPIHLSAAAYEYKIIHQTMNNFMPKFRGDVTSTIYSSGGAQDGWTNNTTIGTTEVRVGDGGVGQSYKGILNFDTSSIPDDATINSLSLYMIRKGLSSTNPFTSGALGAANLDVKSGTFGTVNVEASDFAAVADATNTGCFHGTVTLNGYALRIDLNAAGIAAINKTGNTQFRLSFPNTNINADYVDFNTGNATVDTNLATVGLAEYMNSAKPFIDINYTQPLNVDSYDLSNVILYPNPVKNNFTINGLNSSNYKVQIVSIQGQVVKEIQDFRNEQTVSIDALANGIYFVKIQKDSEFKTIKIIKN
ncbi:T9SS type A sorting domain-containing protein [Flavobacterium sp.]|uniref:T9SS type A sorting domain-containing protein n=1 Tax=Flavobacterium sp. TaxID=239 RepID=UPI002A820ECF|nr:T9SS type A sorting domain-containing protein [Flavobacterium sp.]